jgi:ribosomal protein S27E
MEGRTKSKFVRLKCACGNEQNVFSAIAMEVKCLVCNTPLAYPIGGKLELAEKATLLKVLE